MEGRLFIKIDIVPLKVMPIDCNALVLKILYSLEKEILQTSFDTGVERLCQN